MNHLHMFCLSAFARRRVGIAFVFALVTATTLEAQKVLVPGAPEQQLQLFDLRRTLARGPNAPALTAGEARNTAEMLGQFLEPALRPGDDLTALGNHWLVALTDAPRVAAIERLLQAAGERRDDLLIIETRIFEVAAKAFEAKLMHKLAVVERDTSRSFEAVLEGAAAKAYAELCTQQCQGQLDAPRLSVRPLQRAELSSVNEVSYVRDFAVKQKGGATIIDPIVDKTWDGMRSSLTATFLPDGTIGLRCDVHVRELQRPMPQAEVEVVPDAKPVIVQLPRATGVRLRSVAAVAPGATVVLAAARGNGDYLVALVSAEAIEKRPAAERVRRR